MSNPGVLLDYTTWGAADRVGLVKVRIQYLLEHSSGYIDSLSPEVNRRVQILQKLQNEHDKREAKFREERAALEEKYQKLYAPYYAKRYVIVNGVADPEAENLEAPAAEEKARKEKGVPEFWLTAMKTNKVLALQITERDKGALKYLMDVKCVHLDNPKGFRLDFYFDTNPFFRNSLLSKTYHMVDEDEPIVERAIGTEIEWIAGRNLTQKVVKKQPKKGAKNAKPVMKTVQCRSFFNFFSPPQVSEGDDESDQEEPGNLQYMMEQDYDIGSIIKKKIIPHAVSWFTGDALQKKYDDDSDDEDEDEDKDDDEEEEVDKSREVIDGQRGFMPCKSTR